MISLTRADGFFKVFYCLFLTAETVALLVMQPSKLLQDLCMVGIPVEHTSICIFGVVILQDGQSMAM